MSKRIKKDNLTIQIILTYVFIIILILFLFNRNNQTNNLDVNRFIFLNKQKILSIYLATINFITFVIFGIDKFKSINRKWRIKELTLINLCIIGGSIGGLLSMYLFHHKTKHSDFYIGIPLIIITQIIVMIYIVNIF